MVITGKGLFAADTPFVRLSEGEKEIYVKAEYKQVDPIDTHPTHRSDTHPTHRSDTHDGHCRSRVASTPSSS